MPLSSEKKKKRPSPKVGEEEAPGGGVVAQLHSGSGRAAQAGQRFILGEGHVMPGEEGDTETLSFCPRGQSQGFPSPSPRPGKSEQPADALLTVTVGASGEDAGCGRRPEEGLRLGKLASANWGDPFLVGGCSVMARELTAPVCRWGWGWWVGDQGYWI